MDTFLEHFELQRIGPARPTGSAETKSFTIHHATLRELFPDGGHDLGEIAGQRFRVARCEFHFVTVSEHDAPEAVPLGFEGKPALGLLFWDPGCQARTSSPTLARYWGHDGEMHTGESSLGAASLTLRAKSSWSPGPGQIASPNGLGLRLVRGSLPGWSAGRARLTLNQDKRRRFDSYPGSKFQQVSALWAVRRPGWPDGQPLCPRRHTQRRDNCANAIWDLHSVPRYGFTLES